MFHSSILKYNSLFRAQIYFADSADCLRYTKANLYLIEAFNPCSMFLCFSIDTISNLYFSAFPYQAGSVFLEPIPNVPVAFCKYVHLNNKRFESDFPMHIQLTITWRNQNFKEGAAAWSENATTFGFNACVLVAGRHFLGIAPTPTVFWMAYQKGLMASSEGQLTGGSIDMPSWFSGSRCERLPGVYYSSVKLFC